MNVPSVCLVHASINETGKDNFTVETLYVCILNKRDDDDLFRDIRE